MHIKCIFNWHKLLAWGSFHMSEYLSSYHDMTIDYCNIHIGTYLIACRGVLYHDTYYGRGICNMGDATKIIKE